MAGKSGCPLSRVAEPRSRVMSGSPWREYGPHPSAATPVSLLGPFLSRLAKSEFSLQRMGRGLRTSPLSTPGEEKTPPPLFLTAALKLQRPCSSRPRQRLLIQGVGHRRKSIPDKNQLLPEGAAAIDTRARRGAPSSSWTLLPTVTVGVWGGRHRHPGQMSIPRG